MCPPTTSIPNFLLSSANSARSSDWMKARCFDEFVACASCGAIARMYKPFERSLARFIATSIALSASVDPSCTNRTSSDNVSSMPDKGIGLTKLVSPEAKRIAERIGSPWRVHRLHRKRRFERDNCCTDAHPISRMSRSISIRISSSARSTPAWPAAARGNR